MISPKISIILPCYNVADYLPKCLDTIINQTYTNIEIICVDDGSPDNSIDILNEYKNKDNRIIVVSQKNQGLSGARNTGASYVTGEYIMYVDSDDWIDLETCEKAVNAAVNNDADLVIWNYIREYHNNPLPRFILGNDKLIFDGEECREKIHRRIVGLYNEELSSPETADSLVTAWGKLYKSDLILNNNIKFVDTKLIGTEDALFNIYALNNIKRAVYIPDCLYHYRKDNDISLTSVYKSKLFSQWQYLYSLIEEFIEEQKLDDTYKTALNNRICLGIIGLGLNIMNSEKTNKIKEIKSIISSDRYRKAYKQLRLEYFPVHWRLFFSFAKHNNAFGVFLMLKAIFFLLGNRC